MKQNRIMENDRNTKTLLYSFVIFVSRLFEASFSFLSNFVAPKGLSLAFMGGHRASLPSPSQAAKLEALSNLRQGVPASLLTTFLLCEF